MDAMGRLWSLLLTLLTGRIAGKIVAPYLVLILLLAIGAIWLVTSAIFASLSERYTNQLVDSGRKVNEAMVKLETEQVQALRLMTNTSGVPEAIAGQELGKLQELLLPLQTNANLDLVDVVDADQNILLLLRGESIAAEAAQLVDAAVPTWPLTRRVLAGQSDQLGDKWTELVSASWGEAIYSAAPVKLDGRIVGAVLVGSPLPRVVRRLQQDAQTNVTLYNADGSLRATTLPVEEAARASGGEIQLEVTPEVATQVLSPSPTILRRVVDLRIRNYQELVGALEIRASPVVPLGVSLEVNFIAEQAVQSGSQLMTLFGGVVLVVLVMGLWVARLITRPIATLVDAHREVEKDNLEVDVPITTRDETGILSNSFNQMVDGLRKARHVHSMFGQYVTNQVRDAVLRGEVKLGGDRAEITMLYTDICGFTTLAEGMDPEELVEMLNRYFDVMIDAIAEYEGTLDKFVGDAIVVEFNVPLPTDHHPLRAVLTALRMREKLGVYNAQQMETGEPVVRMGVGIHTGAAVVGNIGSEGRKVEYTAMGDTVNVSARLESLTRKLGLEHETLIICISEETQALVRDFVEVSEPMTTDVKGREAPVTVYKVLDLKPGLELGYHLIELARERDKDREQLPEPALVGGDGVATLEKAPAPEPEPAATRG